MLDFFADGDGRPDSKIFTMLGRLPSYIDHSQPPTKKQPWRAINDVGLVRNVELVLPEELYEVLWTRVEEKLKPVKYASVIMKLEDVLDGDFFTEYIKKGNIVMLSEGQPGVDNVFCLRDGTLRLGLEKEAYERAGLQGQPCRGGGRKHTKAWYVVEVNLRQPSMLHGKRGFERLVWAAKNVLNRSLTWLFYDIRTAEDSNLVSAASSISKHHPIIIDFNPKEMHNPNVRVPLLRPQDAADGYNIRDVGEWSHDVLEWLGLLGLQSSRVQADDHIDPHLCRWSFPADTMDQPTTVRVLQWAGMVDSSWVTQLLITCILQTNVLPAVNPSQTWLALTVQAHPVAALNAIDGYSILLTPETDDPRQDDNESSNNPSGSAAEESGNEQQQSAHMDTESAVVNADGGRGGSVGDPPQRRQKRLLQNFACFQLSDSLVRYK